jgi:hypothetical protein
MFLMELIVIHWQLNTEENHSSSWKHDSGGTKYSDTGNTAPSTGTGAVLTSLLLNCDDTGSTFITCYDSNAQYRYL